MSAKALRFRAVLPPCSFVRSSRQILLPRYLLNGLSNLDETYRGYSVVPTDDLIRFWRSKSRSQKAVEVENTPTSTLGRRLIASNSIFYLAFSLKSERERDIKVILM